MWNVDAAWVQPPRDALYRNLLELDWHYPRPPKSRNPLHTYGVLGFHVTDDDKQMDQPSPVDYTQLRVRMWRITGRPDSLQDP